MIKDRGLVIDHGPEGGDSGGRNRRLERAGGERSDENAIAGALKQLREILLSDRERHQLARHTPYLPGSTIIRLCRMALAVILVPLAYLPKSSSCGELV